MLLQWLWPWQWLACIVVMMVQAVTPTGLAGGRKSTARTPALSPHPWNVRRDRTFTMYQKFDSMYPRRLTGTYSITKDDYKGYVLDGKYDYGTGDWNNAYIVTDLYEESMVLTADAENGDVCKYVRCNEVPEEIITWFESEDAE